MGLLSDLRALICVAVLVPPALTQAAAESSSAAGSGSDQKLTPVDQAIELAEKHRCKEAVPLFEKLTPGIADKQVRYRAEIAMVRCTIKLKDGRSTVTTLLALKHEFPEDPEVLYLTTQVFLAIAENSSKDLATLAPSSYQILELQAESQEQQHKWDEAAKTYREILEQNPKLPGIHLRLGRALLSQQDSTAGAEEASKEFTAELAVDPYDASAEFWLGEVARISEKWDEAVLHFESATKLDPDYAEAYLGQGMSANAAKRYAEAIAPLEHYVKVAPNDPAGHYQLSVAYVRTDRPQDSGRERDLVRQLAEKVQADAAKQSNQAH
jgi:tetratricopeptide (TPR) repeat protein